MTILQNGSEGFSGQAVFFGWAPDPIRRVNEIIFTRSQRATVLPLVGVEPTTTLQNSKVIIYGT